MPLPGLLERFLTNHAHGLFDPGTAGKRAAYASGRSPFSHETASATTHCVAVALQVHVADAHLLGALARIRPFRRRPRQRLFTGGGGGDHRDTVIFGRHRIAPRGRQETLYNLLVSPFFLGPTLHNPGFDNLSTNAYKSGQCSPAACPTRSHLPNGSPVARCYLAAWGTAATQFRQTHKPLPVQVCLRDARTLCGRPARGGAP